MQANLPLVIRPYTVDSLQVTTLLDYRTREVNDAIRALKFEGSDRAARLLSDALADFLREEVATMRAFSARPVILVPVPLHPRRERERGFNQVTRVLEKLPPEFRDGTCARLVPHALARTRATPRQTTLPRHERLTNVHNAFTADERIVRGAHVILVDDVTTTGSTLAACAQALTHAGAKVTAVALAHA